MVTLSKGHHQGEFHNSRNGANDGTTASSGNAIYAVIVEFE